MTAAVIKNKKSEKMLFYNIKISFIYAYCIFPASMLNSILQYPERLRNNLNRIEELIDSPAARVLRSRQTLFSIGPYSENPVKILSQ